MRTGHWIAFHNLTYLVGFCVFSFNVMAQDPNEKDSLALESFSDKAIIKVNMDTQTDSYTLFNKQLKDRLKITPNNSYRLFLSLDYEFIGVSIGFAPKLFKANTDNDLKGESSFADYKFRVFLGKWIQGFQYKKIKGYYVENTEDYIPNWVEGTDAYIQIPDLKNITWGMSTAYVFNPKFSYRNTIYQTEWQKQSAGSFVPALLYSYNNYSFELNGIASDEIIFRTRLTIAYYYTLVIKNHWFIATNVSPSIGVDFSKDKRTENNVVSTEKNTYFTRYLEAGMHIGYSSKRVVFGGSFNVNANWHNEDGINTIENNQVYGVLYFGYRFNAPRVIAKWFEKK